MTEHSDLEYLPHNSTTWLTSHLGRTTKSFVPQWVKDPAKEKAVFAGLLETYGADLHLHRLAAFDTHFMKKHGGYAIQESWFKSMRPEFRYRFIYLYEFKGGVCTSYASLVTDWLEHGTVFDEGHGPQRCLPLGWMCDGWGHRKVKPSPPRKRRKNDEVDAIMSRVDNRLSQ